MTWNRDIALRPQTKRSDDGLSPPRSPPPFPPPADAPPRSAWRTPSEIPRPSCAPRSPPAPRRSPRRARPAARAGCRRRSACTGTRGARRRSAGDRHAELVQQRAQAVVAAVLVRAPVVLDGAPRGIAEDDLLAAVRRAAHASALLAVQVSYAVRVLPAKL